MKYRAFICYETSSADDWARHLKHALENKVGENGIPTCVASQDLPKGPSWEPHRDAALDGCEYLIVLGTQLALASPEVKKEIHMAENQKKFILPCRDSKHVERKAFLALFQDEQRNEIAFGTPEELVREVEAVLRGMEDKGTGFTSYAKETVGQSPSGPPRDAFLLEQWHCLKEASPARVIADIKRWLKRTERSRSLRQEAHSILARAYLMQGQRPFKEGNFSKAQGIYKKALESARDSGHKESEATAALELGVAWGMRGYPEEALKFFDQAIPLNPAMSSAYYNRGVARGQQGDTDGAMADYNKALELNPSYALAYNNRGVARGQQGDTDGAMADYNKALELNPSYALAYYNRGNAKGRQGDNEGAMADYDKALELNPRLAQAYYNRGVARGQQGDTDGAMADYTRALELNPRDAQAYYNRGNAKRQQGDTDGAMADYDEALKINPRLAQAYYNRGNAYVDKKEFDQAIADYTRAIELDPRDAQAYNNRGVAQGQQGDTDGAIADYDEALKINPRDAAAYYNRGVARADKGDTDGAIADYDKALELDPRDAEAYNNRGNARRQQGDLEGSIADYTRALELKEHLPDKGESITVWLKQLEEAQEQKNG